MRPRIYYHADGCTCTPPGGLRLMRPRAFPTFTTMATACHCYLKLDFRRVDQRHCRLMVPILYEVLGFPRLHSNQYGQPLLSARHPIFVHTLHTHSLHFLSSCTRDLGLIPIPPVCGGCRARCYAAVSTRLLHFSLILLWCTRPILFYILRLSVRHVIPLLVRLMPARAHDRPTGSNLSAGFGLQGDVPSIRFP